MISVEATWEQKTKEWWNNKAVCEFSAFLVLFIYTIWEVRNRAIFRNVWNPTDISSTLLIQKAQEHRVPPKARKIRVAIVPVIDKSTPWDFFDGTS